MAADPGIQLPGTKYGPCRDKNCGHKDCAQSRVMAHSRCRLCKHVIGYGARFYRDELADGAWVHAECFEDAVEKEQASANL